MGKKSKTKKQRSQQKKPQTMQVKPMDLPMLGTQMNVPAQATMQPVQKIAGLELGEQFIRRDIVRILVLLGIVAFVLAGLVIMNGQGTAIVTAGQHLAKFFRLQ
jgi:hypothetical protein